MRRFKLICYFLLTTLFLEMPVSLAQNDKAVARYDENGRMILVFGILGYKDMSECSRFVLTGTITSVEYDNQQQIMNFYVKFRAGKPQNVYLTGISHDKRLPQTDVKRLPSLITKGKKVRVTAYACGTSGSHIEAYEIKAL